MRVKLNKSEGTLLLTIDDTITIDVVYTNDYIMGELGHLSQIIKWIYYDHIYVKNHKRKDYIS